MHPKELQAKLKVCWYVVLGLMALLIIKLAFVQFVQSEKYVTKAQENSVRMVTLKAPRGEIYDRNGKILANNRAVYTVSLTYLQLTDQEKVIRRLAELMSPRYPEITEEYINQLIEDQKYRLFEPITVMRDIDWDMVVTLEEYGAELPGVEVSVEPLRYYPEKSLAGHLLGYVHPIYNREELEKSYDPLKYRVGDLVGKGGLEKVYEEYLRGTDGARRVEVDARGRPIRELVTLERKAGNNLQLTLDRDLQQVMELAMDEVLAQLQKTRPKARAASAVLIDVKTGGILAMTSRPSMDPNDFTGRMDEETLNYYFPQGSYDPMNPGAATNRAIQTMYPPGSTFKPITGMALLDSGAMDPQNERVRCTGAYWIKPYIGCWGVHGSVNYFQGMATSCNVFFQEAGRRAGVNEMVRVAREFGLGSKTGIDLPYEKSGLVPDPSWKKEVNSVIIDRRYEKKREETSKNYDALIAAAATEDEKKKLRAEKEKALNKIEAQYRIDYKFETTWQQFDTFNMSIGQGSNNYTVVQLANYVATLANGGYRYQPYLVRKIISPSGETIKEFKPELIQKVNLNPETLAITKEAMHYVVLPGGTGYSIFRNLPPELSGGAKTGTAQTGRATDNKNQDYHGVFIAFAPYDNPEIAFAGVVEYGYHGSTSAGLVAKAVFEHYFGIKDYLAGERIQTEGDNVGPIE